MLDQPTVQEKIKFILKLIRLESISSHTSSNIDGVYFGGIKFGIFVAISFPRGGKTLQYFPVL
jgi:hypothetical protein